MFGSRRIPRATDRASRPPPWHPSTSSPRPSNYWAGCPSLPTGCAPTGHGDARTEGVCLVRADDGVARIVGLQLGRGALLLRPMPATKSSACRRGVGGFHPFAPRRRCPQCHHLPHGRSQSGRPRGVAQSDRTRTSCSSAVGRCRRRRGHPGRPRRGSVVVQGAIPNPSETLEHGCRWQCDRHRLIGARRQGRDRQPLVRLGYSELDRWTFREA